MRRASKVDSNQTEIVVALRSAGASVHPLHTAGDNFPDLAVGFRGVNYLIEVVGEAKAKRFKKTGGLSEGQVEWHEAWTGQCCKVFNVEEALAVIGLHHGVVKIPLAGSIS